MQAVLTDLGGDNHGYLEFILDNVRYQRVPGAVIKIITTIKIATIGTAMNKIIMTITLTTIGADTEVTTAPEAVPVALTVEAAAILAEVEVITAVEDATVIETLVTTVAAEITATILTAKTTTTHATKIGGLYCWTHGNNSHTSGECSFPTDGHKNTATFANMQGGVIVIVADRSGL